MQDGKQVYLIMLHNEKYPSRTSDDSAGSSEPRLVVTGKFKECNYWFQEFQSREQRRIARVDRNLEDDRRGEGKDAYIVQVAASVDVALILLVTMIIDACEHDDTDANENYTGRESTLDSSRTGDDRCRDSLSFSLSLSLSHSLLSLSQVATLAGPCANPGGWGQARCWRQQGRHTGRLQSTTPMAQGQGENPARRWLLAYLLLLTTFLFSLSGTPLLCSALTPRLSASGGSCPLHGALSLVTLSPYSQIAICHSRA
jgi:hypothetical protein